MVVDKVENLAIDRVKQLFGAEFVNVQPHSGAQANQAVLLAILKPGDTFMGLDLDQGATSLTVALSTRRVFSTTTSAITSAARRAAWTTTRWRSWPRRTSRS